MSKEQDIVEGNFKISVFNGWTYKNVNEFIKDKTSTELHNYHVDWNKLMAIVEKIEKIEFNDATFEIWIMKHEINVLRLANGMSIRKSIYSFHYDENKIENVWMAVTQFLQWYQQNQKPQ